MFTPRFPLFAVKILDPLTDIATSSLSPSKPVFDVPKFIAGADAVPVPTDNPELVDKSTKPGAWHQVAGPSRHPSRIRLLPVSRHSPGGVPVAQRAS